MTLSSGLMLAAWLACETGQANVAQKPGTVDATAQSAKPAGAAPAAEVLSGVGRLGGHRQGRGVKEVADRRGEHQPGDENDGH